MPAMEVGYGVRGVVYVEAALTALESLVRSKKENVCSAFLGAVGLKKNSVSRHSKAQLFC